MRSIETSGKTVEDAVKAGLAELKCDSADVNIDVLEMGSPGLFGMFGRLARVRLTVKATDDFDIEMPVMTLEAQKPRADKKPPEKKPPQPEKQPDKQPEQRPEKPAQERRPEPKPAQEPAAKAPERRPEPKPTPEKAERQPSGDNQGPVIKSVAEFKASRRDPREPRAQRGPREPREQQEPREQREPRRRFESAPRESMPAIPAEPLPPLDVEALDEIGKRAHHFLTNVTGLMGVEVDIRMKGEEGHLFVQMTGDELGVLIGRRGETLDALQYLTSLVVNKSRDDYTRVSLDSEHYRAKREDALRKLASRMAARARKTGHRVALEPMNPYERRVLHSALQDNPYVTTHSEGEEPYRRVIITLK